MFPRGKHVNYVPGAGEDAVIVHLAKDNGSAPSPIQLPDGQVIEVPRREPKGGVYDGSEDLGRTWHTIRGDDSPREGADEEATA